MQAACFLRMVHHLVLGDDTFHNATKDYLKTHAFSNANHSHIIKIWQEVMLYPQLHYQDMARGNVIPTATLSRYGKR